MDSGSSAFRGLTADSPRMRLIVEERSRFGDDGRLLHSDDIPADGLGRVVAEYESASDGPITPEDAQAAPLAYQYSTLIAASALAASPGTLRVWCVGRVLRREAKLFTDSGASHAAVAPIAAHDSLLVCPLPADTALERIAWPAYGSETGAHLFLFTTEGTDLERRLRHLLDLVVERPAEARAVWRSFCWRECLSRRALAGMCEQVSLLVAPDGEHFQDAAFHSRRLGAAEIASVIERLVLSSGARCEIFPSR